MRLLLIGPPNAGKGTQAQLLTKWFGIPHISTGNILRENIASDSALGKEVKSFVEAGKLVPDELVMKLVADTVEQLDLDRGFLFDGYPRNIVQAESFDQLLESLGKPIDAVVLLSVEENILVKRATGRRVCSGCGQTYHVTYQPPKTSGVCDKCGGDLIFRKDDQAETVLDRLDIYKKQTRPLVNYYDQVGKLVRVDGSLSPDQVFEQIKNALEAHQ